MLLSKYFLPILKENSKDASIVSHNLMLRAGLIRQNTSGIYTWLPMGFKILNKISQLVTTEMDKTGALQMLMPTIQSADLWKKSGRYETYGLEMLKIKDRHHKDLLYGPTNEEQITNLFKDNIKSYKNLPLNLYHIQWKFRDEIRPRFGVMRGREFLMKDAYSFDVSADKASIAYKKMFACYLKIFQNLGLTAIPMKADNGEMGGDLSHEFMILAPNGESEVYFDKTIKQQLLSSNINYDTDCENIFQDYTSYYATTSDKHNLEDDTYSSNKKNIISGRGIEIAHIFYLGDKYSTSLQAQVLTQQGKNIAVHMGSYGVGISRLLGAMIESSHDDKGIIWNKQVAPYDVIINSLGSESNIVSTSLYLYNFLKAQGFDVLYNDKNDSISNKLATADLIGIPWQINIGNKQLQADSIEIKARSNHTITAYKLQDTQAILKALSQ